MADASLLSPHAPRSDGGRAVINLEADKALELSIKTAAATPKKLPPIPQAISVAFIVVTMLVAFCIGLIYGWGPFEKILEDEKIYADNCAPDEPQPCHAQTIFYSVIFACASGTLSFGGLLAGVLLDSGGPTAAALVAGGLIGIGMLLLAWLPASAAGWFALPFMLSAGGGILTALTAFKSAAVLPSKVQSLVITSVNVVFDISATVPLLAYELHFAFGLSRPAIFTPYAVYVFALYLAWAVLWRRLEPRLHVVGGNVTDADEDGDGDKPATGKHSPAPPPPPIEPMTPMDGPDYSLEELLFSKQYVVGMVWFSVHQFRSNMYLGSAADMLRHLGDADSKYMEMLTATLAAAVPFIPLISAATDALGVAGSMQAVTGLAVLHAACALVPSLSFQPVTFVVFTLLRAATYSVAALFVAKTFGFARMGTLYGLMQASGAVPNLALPLITSLVLNHFGGDWSPIMWGFLLVCGVQFGLVSWVVHALTLKERSWA